MSWSPIDESKPSDEAVIGDEPFDLVADCFQGIADLYERDWKRKPTLRELIGTVQAVLETQLHHVTSDGETAELTSLTFKTRRIRKRQQYAEGDVLSARLASGESVYARVFEIRSGIGPLVGVYDSRGMPHTDLDGIIQRPLAVKVFPIHCEILETREWLVIGNRPLTAADAKLARGPIAITGDNIHLQAANYYYGLAPALSEDYRNCVLDKAGGA
jgi:hypothetical protein